MYIMPGTQCNLAQHTNILRRASKTNYWQELRSQIIVKTLESESSNLKKTRIGIGIRFTWCWNRNQKWNHLLLESELWILENPGIEISTTVLRIGIGITGAGIIYNSCTDDTWYHPTVHVFESCQCYGHWCITLNKKSCNACLHCLTANFIKSFTISDILEDELEGLWCFFYPNYTWWWVF